MERNLKAHVVHLIVGLEIGGAELMLKRLVLSATQHSPYRHCVVSLTQLGPVGAQLRAAGIAVYALNMSSVALVPLAAWRLARLLRTLHPSVVQTWMYHADFMGGWIGRLLGYRVVWNIRSTGIPQGRLSLTWWLIRLNAFSSRFVPRKIICCADSAKSAHVALGYDAAKMLVIPNGYAFSMSLPVAGARATVRSNLGLTQSHMVIGVVGRFDPLKDYPNFIQAAKVVAMQCAAARFLLVGRGLDADNAMLCEWIAAEGLSDRFRLVGEQTEVGCFLAAMDIFCLSSKQEAFPNVVVEAMATGLPCVVTNAGDAAAIVGDGRFVVPVQDSASLGRALNDMCRLPDAERLAIGAAGAALVRAKYDIDLVRRKYEATYDDLINSPNTVRH